MSRRDIVEDRTGSAGREQKFGSDTYTMLGFPDPAPDSDGTGEFGAAAATPAEPTELLVQFAPGASAASIEAAAAAIGGQVVETIQTPAMALAQEGVLVRVTIGAGLELNQAVDIVTQRPGVLFAEPNWQVSLEATSNDPAYTNGTLWGMYGDSTSPTNQYGSQSGEAWTLGYTGSSAVVVGVVDTGIDYTHPDLYLNIWLNQGEIPSSLTGVLVDVDSNGLITFWDLNATVNSNWVADHNNTGYIDAGDLLVDSRWEDGIDNDGNGYVDDLVGWDFVNNDNDPRDDNGHGTHVAGTIGAIGGNATGVAGVAWTVQIIPLKFLNSNGSGTTAGAIQALDYFTYASAITPTQDFVATNNSWGGGGYSQALLDSIVRGAKQDILFIAAAGNGGRDGKGDNNDSSPFYPSSYDTTAAAGYDAVIAVASITKDGALSSFSNYGANSVDLGAPGQSIYSTLPGGYGTYSGTSMATPHVTGAVALYAAATGASAAEIRAALLGSTAATASLSGKTVTDGRLDVGALMQGAAPAPEPVDSTPPAAPLVIGVGSDTGVSATDAITKDQTLIISGTGEPGTSVEVFRDLTSIGVTTVDSAGNWRLDATSTVLNPGSYAFTATASDAAGNTSAMSAALSVTIDIAVAAPSELDLLASSDTGTSSSDNLTSDPTPTVSGLAEPGAAIALTAGGVTLGTATADAGGLWSVTASALAEGAHDLTAIATDLAGNVSPASSALALVIDTTAPVAAASQIVVAGDNIISSEESTAENGVVIEVRLTEPVVASETVYVVVGDASIRHPATLDSTDATGLTYKVALPYSELSGSSSVSAFVQDAAGNANAAVAQSYTVEQSGPNYVYGTNGSDPNVQGTVNDDIISGLAENSTTLGAGTVDTLIGDGGNDFFIFGDKRGAYYDDGSNRTSGTSDYGLIADFSAGDVIQLHGAANDYFLSTTTVNGQIGTGIYFDSNDNAKLDRRDELVGVVQGPDSTSLDLASAQFSYVTPDPVV